MFFEARGQTWALVHLLKAVEHDFGPVLDDKNARVSLRQIIRELEATQEPIWSPMILNGSGFGFVANHSLVMASYISRVKRRAHRLAQSAGQGLGEHTKRCQHLCHARSHVSHANASA